LAITAASACEAIRPRSRSTDDMILSVAESWSRSFIGEPFFGLSPCAVPTRVTGSDAREACCSTRVAVARASTRSADSDDRARPTLPSASTAAACASASL